MEQIQHSNHEYEDVPIFKKNPFAGYLEKLKNRAGQRAVNDTHEVVNAYYRMSGHAHHGKEFYKGRYAYGRLAIQAKALLAECGGNLEDALWCLDKMKYIAGKKGFDWAISTCIKYNLRTI